MTRHADWDVACKIYIGGLLDTAERYDLEEAFGKFGRVKNSWVARRPPGFGFIEMEDPRDAADAAKELNGSKIAGARVRVEMSRPNSRREGGDRGGGGGRGRYNRSRSRDRRQSRSRSREYRRPRRSPSYRSMERRRSPSYDRRDERRERDNSRPRNGDRDGSRDRERDGSGSKGRGKEESRGRGGDRDKSRSRSRS